MTGDGFPHSDIHGSKLSRQLPVAYRSQTRLSSVVGAKASTVGSNSLGERINDARARYAVLKGRLATVPTDRPRGPGGVWRAGRAHHEGDGRSLKTEQKTKASGQLGSRPRETRPVTP